MIKLLLVEDDATLRYMIRNSLEVVIGGYEMAEAANGAEGLELWKTFRPDIIVADVEMPVMDGYEMVAKIRETDRLQPIVFASGMEDPSHVMRGYEVGVNNYIKKPYLPEELDAHVRALLRNINMGGRMENNTETYPIGRWKFNADIIRQSKSTRFPIKKYKNGACFSRPVFCIPFTPRKGAFSPLLIVYFTSWKVVE